MGQLQQRGIASDTRVVDEHVNGTDVCLDLPDAVLTGLVIADIPFEHRNAGSFQKCHRTVDIATIVGRDWHARVTHRAGNRRPDAARPACYSPHIKNGTTRWRE